VSDDPAEWLRQLAAGIRADPEVPPGVIVLESGTERIARTASHPGGLVTAELAEDLRSFCESFHYSIRLSGRGEPIRCEVCGTLVSLTPETEDADAVLGAVSRWKPGIWEHETLRKHTMRRCEWKRANGGLALA
jgi:hypothetical protein